MYCAHGFIHPHNCGDCLIANGGICNCKLPACKSGLGWAKAAMPNYGSIWHKFSGGLGGIIPTHATPSKSPGELLHERWSVTYEALGGMHTNWETLEVAWQQAFEAIATLCHNDAPPTVDSLVEQLLAMNELARQRAYQLLYNSGCRLNKG